MATRATRTSKTVLRAAFAGMAAGTLLLAPLLPAMADRLVTIDTRPGVTVSFWYMPRPGAAAIVALLPGGRGSIGMKHGEPTSQNFLVRSRDLFARRGLSVAIVGRPSDRKDLDNDFRADSRHVEDLRRVVAHLKKESGLPVWLIGTSRGTISAAAAAIAFGTNELAGIVLTSSVTSYRIASAVPRQKLDRIRIPALVVHHEKDACRACAPYEVKYILRGLANAPVSKLIMINGGGDPRGDPCEALHWHGYIGAEAETVDAIVGWINNPQP